MRLRSGCAIDVPHGIGTQSSAWGVFGCALLDEKNLETVVEGGIDPQREKNGVKGEI